MYRTCTKCSQDKVSLFRSATERRRNHPCLSQCGRYRTARCQTRASRRPRIAAPRRGPAAAGVGSWPVLLRSTVSCDEGKEQLTQGTTPPRSAARDRIEREQCFTVCISSPNLYLPRGGPINAVSFSGMYRVQKCGFFRPQGSALCSSPTRALPFGETS
jgi:hypothetical protein